MANLPVTNGLPATHCGGEEPTRLLLLVPLRHELLHTKAPLPVAPMHTMYTLVVTLVFLLPDHACWWPLIRSMRVVPSQACLLLRASFPTTTLTSTLTWPPLPLLYRAYQGTRRKRGAPGNQTVAVQRQQQPRRLEIWLRQTTRNHPGSRAAPRHSNTNSNHILPAVSPLLPVPTPAPTAVERGSTACIEYPPWGPAAW